MSAPKKQKFHLNGRPSPLVLKPDDMWDDEPEVNPSGTLKKGKNSKTGQRKATTAEAEEMGAASNLVGMVNLAFLKACVVQVEAERKALRLCLTPSFERVPVAGFAEGFHCTASVNCETAEAKAALTSGMGVDTLFVVDVSAFADDKAVATLSSLIEETCGALRGVVGHSSAHVAFGWFNNEFEMGSGLDSWQKMDVLTEEVCRDMAEARICDREHEADFLVAMKGAFDQVSKRREQVDAPVTLPLHVVFLTYGKQTDPSRALSAQAVRELVEFETAGTATVVSCISVGDDADSELVDALVANTGGYAGHCGDTAHGGVVFQLDLAFHPFVQSNKPFALHIQDASRGPGNQKPHVNVFGMLHEGNCEVKVELSIGSKTTGGRHVGATVGRIDQLDAICRHVPTNLMLEFVESEEEYDAWLAEGQLSQP